MAGTGLGLKLKTYGKTFYTGKAMRVEFARCRKLPSLTLSFGSLKIADLALQQT